jgi:ubiquinone/menaquinone biosynthesis C-methylase UbiE
MSGPEIDPEAFRNFERAAHSRIADSYHDRFGVVTDRATAPLLDAARVGAGTRLLDVAAGPGSLTREAARRGAHAVGTDIAPAMIELARKQHPGLDFQEASADALPFADGSFNAVVCAFGMGHFPEAERVIAEFIRVLTPGGIVALSWWDGFAHNRINGIFHETLGRLNVSASGKLPPGPPMDRFSDRARFAEFLGAAGLSRVLVEAVTFTHRLRDADDLWDLAMGSFARASTLIRAQPTAMQQTIRDAVNEAAQKYAGPNGLDIPVAFLVTSGTKA